MNHHAFEDLKQQQMQYQQVFQKHSSSRHHQHNSSANAPTLNEVVELPSTKFELTYYNDIKPSSLEHHDHSPIRDDDKSSQIQLVDER